MQKIKIIEDDLSIASELKVRKRRLYCRYNRRFFNCFRTIKKTKAKLNLVRY